LWVLHTYAPDCFDFTPRICISSPEKRCGKTTLLSLLEHLSFKVINASNITASAMFRAVEMWGPTILIDEADTFLKGNTDLCGAINAGYQKGGKITRTEQIGKQLIPKNFNCFAPCAIASIGYIPETILDRGFVITMKRKTKTENKESLRAREIKPVAVDIQRKCLRFMADNAETISDARPIMPARFNDRAADVWEPLFAIASVISPQWLQKTEQAAITLVNEQAAEDVESVRIQLLQDIKRVFKHTGENSLPSEVLVDMLRKIEGSPWADWNNGHGFTVHALARQLRYFKLASIQRREDGWRARRYNLKDFQDTFARYL